VRELRTEDRVLGLADGEPVLETDLMGRAVQSTVGMV
jgi:hypothetical protein